MSTEHPFHLDARTRQAVEELQGTIGARYPAATFEVVRAADDPTSIHLIASVDVEDPDEVGDLVLDRVVQLQVDEHIPVHVIPIRTPERIQAEPPASHGLGRQRFGHEVPLFERLPVVHR